MTQVTRNCLHIASLRGPRKLSDRGGDNASIDHSGSAKHIIIFEPLKISASGISTGLSMLTSPRALKRSNDCCTIGIDLAQSTTQLAVPFPKFPQGASSTKQKIWKRISLILPGCTDNLAYTLSWLLFFEACSRQNSVASRKTSYRPPLMRPRSENPMSLGFVTPKPLRATRRSHSQKAVFSLLVRS